MRRRGENIEDDPRPGQLMPLLGRAALIEKIGAKTGVSEAVIAAVLNAEAEVIGRPAAPSRPVEPYRWLWFVAGGEHCSSEPPPEWMATFVDVTPLYAQPPGADDEDPRP